jgi:hypothetical protein
MRNLPGLYLVVFTVYKRGYRCLDYTTIHKRANRFPQRFQTRSAGVLNHLEPSIHSTLLERFGCRRKKRGSAQLIRTPFPGLFQTALLDRLNKRTPGLHQIKAIVLHHLGPCRDEVIGELVLCIIGCIDFCNGTQLGV